MTAPAVRGRQRSCDDSNQTAPATSSEPASPKPAPPASSDPGPIVDHGPLQACQFTGRHPQSQCGCFPQEDDPREKKRLKSLNLNNTGSKDARRREFARRLGMKGTTLQEIVVRLAGEVDADTLRIWAKEDKWIDRLVEVSPPARHQRTCQKCFERTSSDPCHQCGSSSGASA